MWGNIMMPPLMMLLVSIFVHYHSVFPEQKRLGGHRILIICLIYAVAASLLSFRILISLGFLLPNADLLWKAWRERGLEISSQG